jgi:hypothetical protein
MADPLLTSSFAVLARLDEPFAPGGLASEAAGVSFMQSVVDAAQNDAAWHDWTAVAMVSEPTSYALWLCGVAVIGFVALRRSDRWTNETAATGW